MALLDGAPPVLDGIVEVIPSSRKKGIQIPLPVFEANIDVAFAI
jgi:hypothetical protein